MKSIVLCIILIIPLTSCSTTFLRDEITIKDLIIAKDRIDQTENPAEILLLKNNLSEKILVLNEIAVKDIVNSTNVDYDFCVIAEISSEKGPIECFIYTKNIKRISQLKKGKSIISVKGEFKRYFSMLDNFYTKIEITNSIIKIKTE
jgi:hypothetical protein